MRYYLIAGEASGDLHGSNLIKAIKAKDANAQVRCWGGDLMQSAGSTVVKHYKDLAFMGFVEVIANLGTILKNLKFCKQDITAFKPDVLVLIDYPGFNIRIAKWAKAQGLKVVYYISPQVWAWKAGRVHTLKKCVDRMLTILPFEKDFYKKYQWDVDYVGHPLVEVIDNYLKDHPRQTNQNTIALLPGSRKQEIMKKLPVMLEVTKQFPEFQFIIARAPSLPSSLYDEMLKDYPNVACVEQKTYDVLLQSRAALVTSGTATLETALLQIPQVICYKGNKISFLIAKKLVDIKYIGLPNLIVDKPIVKELIQDDFNTQQVADELRKLLDDKEAQQQMQVGYRELRACLQSGGSASMQAASIIMEELNATSAV
jgi:lipid-A-disaccharide synthase